MTFALAAALWPLAALQLRPAPVGPLTIEQAADLAARNAFAVRIQATNVERSRQRLAEAIGNLGPKVGVGLNYNRFGQVTTAQIGPPGTPPVIVSPVQTTNATATFSLPIDISGNQHRLARASEAQLRAARTTLEASLNDARLNGRTAFLDVLRARAQVGVFEQALRDAEERLRQGQLQLQQLQVARIDVDRLEAAVAQARSDLLIGQNNQRLAENALNFVLARPIETPVELVDVTELPPVQANPDELARRAEESRPEVRAQRENLDALANIRRAQEAGLNPSLNFSVSLNRVIGPVQGFSARSSSATASFGLSLPVFDSGVTRARVRQARQDEEAARIQLEQIQLGISQEVRNALATLASASARLDNARRQLALAEEVYRLAVVRQQAGVGTYVDIVDAVTTLTQARTGVVSARYDYLTAYSQLLRAIGADQVGAPLAPPPSGGASK